MEGKPLPRFTPGAGVPSAGMSSAGMSVHQCPIGTKRPILGIVEAAEEQNQSFIARPHRPDLDRFGIRRPIGSRGKLGGNAVAVLRVQQLDQLPSFQILRCGAEQLADRAVRLLEAPGAVEQRNTHRGVGETTPKAFERSQGSLPLALGGQIAHD